MKVYLSGPMTGLPEYNYPMFNRVASDLRSRGYEVYNPAEFAWDGPLDDFPLRAAFKEYCSFICEDADAIVMLPRHEASKGASVELALAKVCGLEVIDWVE